MFEIKELEFLRTILKETEYQDETTVSLIQKIDETLDAAKDYKQCLWNFYWDCGRQGEVEGLFKATKEEVESAIGMEVYFGEILGKHSEVYGIIEDGEITLESDDPLEVMNAKENGYNPLSYLKYKCPVCGDEYILDEHDAEIGMCEYCKVEQDKKKEKE